MQHLSGVQHLRVDRKGTDPPTGSNGGKGVPPVASCSTSPLTKLRRPRKKGEHRDPAFADDISFAGKRCRRHARDDSSHCPRTTSTMFKPQPSEVRYATPLG
ncbi:hypothetical protein TNIN_125541 [Trichonephila inaurata madagascariensis]|uniref:Uncharacterized protein n=1 Tax=Trichonephila inaurata madagascariensis TaxID=2747483 RepID=A0A8X6XUM5_9ARAC|nr:hypothetical protein TNIN_125541 [Trichonephila inaurata madagascariensis]